MNFGLIGFPLSHSFSKKYFEEKFEKEKLNGFSYNLFPIASIKELPKLLAEKKLNGLNVTIPYKESVLKFCTNFSEEVNSIGATNCLKIVGEKIAAFNTDAIGFEKSIQPLLKAEHTKALVLGTGGSSKAVRFIFKKLGIPFSLVSRNNNADFSYSTLQKEDIAQHNIIVNTTPLGMFPKQNEQPEIPYDAITKQHLVIDLVYNPTQTNFLLLAARKGATIKNGLDMLHFQAEAAWKIWTS